jgi:site-specific DNA recombinase
MKEKPKVENEMLLKKFAKGKGKEELEIGIQNCVIYTRVSSKEQMDTNQSLEWQKKYCVEYAIKNKLNIKGYFGGTYESAKSDERKEFTRMLKFVKLSREKISFILVYSLDRFSRTGDSAIFISSELKKTGVNIMAVTQPIDTNSHAGALQQNIQFIFSKYDNDLRRQKTIDGMREKLLRGEWIGNAPTGYSFVKGAATQTIIINEKGEAMKQAFIWRANGMTYEQITEKLKPLGVIMPKQTLTGIFSNPFYCGFMSHNLLNGEVIRGKHPALIDEDLFLRANALKKTDGFKVNKANDNLPLKVFVKDAETGIPFTGYIVKKKKLHYYKVNKIGIGINRSANMMHEKFREFLGDYTINTDHVEPLQIQLRYTWDNLTESNTGEKKALSLKLNEVEEEYYNLRKRHAIGKVTMDIYEEFSEEMKVRKKKLLEEFEKLDQKLSNPKELIHFTTKLTVNLAPVWDSGNYYEKQIFQNTIFPAGLGYDSKKEHYRTTEINDVIGYVAQLSKGLEEIKKPDFSNFKEKSGLVPRRRLELPRLAAYAPQAYLYTIPTPGHTFQQKLEQTLE